MIRLLRRFAQFRAMEDECQALRSSLQEATQQSLLLQDRLDAALNHHAEVWALVRESLDNERQALRSQANWNMQSHYGVKPYPEAHALPDSVTPDLNAPRTVARRMTPSEAMVKQKNRAIAEFIADHSNSAA